MPNLEGSANKKIIIIAVLAIVTVVLALGYIKALSDIRQLEDPEAQAETDRKEIEEIVKRVSRHLFVPEEGLPLLATVVDAEALASEQPFYRGVEIGDKVLIYAQTQRAIIYSPERDLIVNVGPVIVNNQDATDGGAANQ